MAQIATEAVEQLQTSGVNTLDYFVAACGNGATVVGPGPVLKKVWPTMKTVLFETANAPSGYRRLHPDYPQKGGTYHSLFGTGGWDVLLPFLNDPQYGFERFSDDDVLITEEDLQSTIAAAPSVPFNVGNSSLAALWVTRKVAAKHPGTTLFTMFYDVGSKYGR